MDGLGGGGKKIKKSYAFLSFFLSTKSASFFQHKLMCMQDKRESANAKRSNGKEKPLP
jgi:hypothetical protein